MNIPENSHETVDFAVTLESTSHSWWHSTKVNGKLDGKSEGTSVHRSGTFDDIPDRGSGTRDLQFTGINWYDRGGITVEDGVYGYITYGWAIDGRQATAPTIYQTAASITASLTKKAFLF